MLWNRNLPKTTRFRAKSSFILACIIFAIFVFSPRYVRATECIELLHLYYIECDDDSCTEGFLVEDRFIEWGEACERLPYVTDVTIDELQRIAKHAFSHTGTKISPGIYQIKISTLCNIHEANYFEDSRCKDRIYVDRLTGTSLSDLEKEKDITTRQERILFNWTRVGMFQLFIGMGVLIPLVVTWQISKLTSKRKWPIFSLLLLFQLGLIYALAVYSNFSYWSYFLLICAVIILGIIVEIVYMVWTSITKKQPSTENNS